MKTHVKIYFSPEGKDLRTILKIMESLGFNPEPGDFDFVVEWKSYEEYLTLFTKMHNLLKGTGVMYRITTK
ncbi:MAG: hypothetical protein WC974_02135 [Thermoplasmata archaeon]